MQHRFRDSYQGIISADLMTAGTLEFFVDAVDEYGNQVFWPASAEAGLPWSLTITEPRISA